MCLQARVLWVALALSIVNSVSADLSPDVERSVDTGDTAFGWSGAVVGRGGPLPTAASLPARPLQSR